MKAIQNYSINVVVLENFNDIVPSQTRSKVIEALMIEYMVKLGEEGANLRSPTMVGKTIHDATQEDSD